MTPLLAVTSEPALAEAVQRLAAVAGLDCDVLPPTRCTPAAWVRPPLVVVGTDAVSEFTAPMPTRTGVVVASPEGETASAWEGALAIGARNVIALPQGEGWLVEQMLAIADTGERSGTVVAVVGASGGIGASLLAVALAREAARIGERCVLIDADAFGGGLDLVVSGEQVTGARWVDIAHARGRLAPGALIDALPHDGDVALLSHGVDTVDVAAETMASVIAAARGGSDLVVLDLPRHLLDEDLAEHVDTVVLVVANRLRAVNAGSTLLRILRTRRMTTHIVVRDFRRPGGIARADIEHALGAATITAIDDDLATARAVENGDPWPQRGPVAKAARTVVGALR